MATLNRCLPCQGEYRRGPLNLSSFLSGVEFGWGWFWGNKTCAYDGWCTWYFVKCAISFGKGEELLKKHIICTVCSQNYGKVVDPKHLFGPSDLCPHRVVYFDKVPKVAASRWDSTWQRRHHATVVIIRLLLFNPIENIVSETMLVPSEFLFSCHFGFILYIALFLVVRK